MDQGIVWGEAPKVRNSRDVTGSMWSEPGAMGQVGGDGESQGEGGKRGPRDWYCLLSPKAATPSAAQSSLIQGAPQEGERH